MSRLPLLLFPVLLVLVGCQTAPDTERPELTAPFAVSRGMAAEEITANLGEPDLRHPLADYSVDAEVWVYNRTLKTSSRMVVTGMRPTRLWDPLNQRIVVVDMPVYQPETNATVEVSEILMIRGKVHSWKRKTINNRETEGLRR